MKRTHGTDTDFGLEVEEFRPQIPFGEYEAICYRVETGWCYGRRNLYVLFRICNTDHEGVELFMTCTYPKGRQKIKPTWKVYTQWMLAMGRRPKKGERISMKAFPHKMYRVWVQDSQRKFTNTNRLMPDYMQYSIVGTIIETMTGMEPRTMKNVGL